MNLSEIFPRPRDNFQYLAAHVLDHCNLNCADCSHFSPLMPKREYKPEEYYPWLDIIMEKVGPPRFFGLSGGEPFLHSNLPDFVDKIHTRYPELPLQLLSNCFWLRSSESINKYTETFSKIKLFRVGFYPKIVEGITLEKFQELLAEIKDKHPNLSIYAGGVYWCGRTNNVFTTYPKISSFDRITFTSEPMRRVRPCILMQCTQLLTTGKIMRCPAGYAFFTQNELNSFGKSQDMFYDLTQCDTDSFYTWLYRRPFDACYYCKRTPTNWITTNELRSNPPISSHRHTSIRF